MNNKLLLCAAVLAISGAVNADDQTSLKKSENTSPVALHGYSQSNPQIDNIFLAPADSKSLGLRVDYKPFTRSGFNVSAGSVAGQATPVQSMPVIHRTYLGVGWKKLVDSARNLGVRVDIGAIYDENEQSRVPVESLSQETGSLVVPAWNPVISLGVSYRF